jgi:hypothetical protein
VLGLVGNYFLLDYRATILLLILRYTGVAMKSTVARIKTALVLIVLMVVSVVPIPVTSTIGLLIVIFRPDWFKRLVDTIYSDKQ